MSFISRLRKRVVGEKVDYSEKIEGGAIVLDVRSVLEFKSGHASGSINVPLSILPSKVNEFKGKEVIVVCLSGGRAGQAKNFLLENGIVAHNAGRWQNVRN